MIGKVTFERAGRRLEMTLDDDLGWSCAGAPELARLIGEAHAPRPDGSPAAGPVGHREVHAVADLLGGAAGFPDRDRPAGRIY